MSRTAVIAGVGPGLGASLVKKFAREGCLVGMFARSADYLQNRGYLLHPWPGRGPRLQQCEVRYARSCRSHGP